MGSKINLEDFEKIVAQIIRRYEIRSLMDAERRARNTGFATAAAALLFIVAYKMGWLLGVLTFGYDPNVAYFVGAMYVAGKDIVIGSFLLLVNMYILTILNPTGWSTVILPIAYILIGLSIGSFYEYSWYYFKIEELKEEKKSKKLEEKQKRRSNR